MCNKQGTQSGFTLIELIIAIVVLGVGVAGVMLAFNTTVRSSADPLITKQMLAAAEETLEEIQLKPHTTSIAAGGAAVVCGAAGAIRKDFDDVGDYNNYQTTGICDIDGAAITGLSDYNLAVTVTSGTWQGIANTLQITVTVTRGTDTLTLNGWRTPYAT